MTTRQCPRMRSRVAVAIYRNLAFLFLLGCSCLRAESWPTQLHDNQRTGQSSESLELPLALQWSRKHAAPKPAWPLPAKQDYWHRKTDLQPRIVHDRAHGIVAAHQRLVVSSSADDQVRSYDAQTGKLLWTTFAEGPVRLSPSIWKQMVVFTADDGFAYGVDLISGRRQWRVRPKEVGPRRIPGNGRIISERPIRSGVMIDENGTGYFAAGIFPLQGSYFFSIDVRNGKILDQAKIQKSIQGYLEQRNGQIFGPTGRDPKGVSLKSLGTAGETERNELAAGCYSMVKDSRSTFLGKENNVSAVNGNKEIWSAKVQGRVYSMAIADGRLFVSTDSGWLYAFGRKPTSDSQPPTELTDQPLPTDVRQLATVAADAQDQSKETRPGYALYVDPAEQRIPDIVAKGSQAALQTVVALSSPSRADQLRLRLADEGVYGSVVVHEFDKSAGLPYGNNIFLDVVGDSASQYAQHVLPQILREKDREKASKGATNDSWTHTYGGPGNQASSQARVGGSAMQLQWFGGPGPRNMVDRHMRSMPPLVHNGIMYVAGLNRVIAVDAFTGTVFWEHEIPRSTRIGILKDCGWMVATDNGLLVAVEDQLVQIETRSDGSSQRNVCRRVPAQNRHWGYLANVEQVVLGSTTLPGSHRQTINRDAILEGAYSDNRPIVCSDTLFAFASDMSHESPLWHYKSTGAILNPTVAASQTSVFFLENRETDFEATNGRIPLAEFLRSGAKLVALDLASGQRKWSIDVPAIPGAQNAFVLCDESRVVMVNSRNAATVHYDVRAYGSQDGKELWTSTQDNKKRPGGDHGEQDKHPLIVGSRLVVEPYAYDLDTGSKLTEFDLTKRGYGCGTLSASTEALFFRSGNPATYSLRTNKIDLLTSVTRPNCWINMIPANGMLLIPEGSSGCTCNFAIQTSMALVPVEE